MMESRNYSPPAAAEAEAEAIKIEHFTCSEPLLTPSKKKNKNKRRFSDEQVRLLESMFELETKLEPRKKLQLARELGLQPRQVAIWFQNKRARWKSKQIEKDYRILKTNYDNLITQFEALKKEKQSLLIQLQKLNGLLEQPHDRTKGSKSLEGNSMDGGSDYGDANCEIKVNPGSLRKRLDHKVVMALDDVKSRSIGCSRQEEGQEDPKMSEHVDGSSASPEKWCRVDICGLMEQSCVEPQWWEFWT